YNNIGKFLNRILGMEVHQQNALFQYFSDTLNAVLSDDAKQHWIDQYNSSANVCSHAYWRGNCKKVSVGLQCDIGLRCRTYYVLCGSVLSVWTKVEGVLASVSGANVKIQIVRLRTEDGQRIVGMLSNK
ncbi:protein strawberry notch homolog 1-like, partial [Sinocyclocheilus grahami]|uniref:protein strawberry notch homolog 1-like n=1 Tax=Sinocyclocheilus grahami TaxID=75366 RepID=UPI0007AD17FE